MNKVLSTLKNPTLWQGVVGLGSLAASVTLLVLAIQSIHCGGLSIHWQSYNTLAAFDLVKTAGYLMGAGGAGGVGLYIFKKMVVHRLSARLEKAQEKHSWIKGAVRAVRYFSPVLSLGAIAVGITLIILAFLYIYSLPHQPSLTPHVQLYLANKQLLIANMVGTVFGSCLVALGFLDLARFLSLSYRFRSEKVLSEHELSDLKT